MDLAPAFVEASQCERGEANRPDALVDFFKGDVLAGEGGGNKEVIAMPCDTPVV